MRVLITGGAGFIGANTCRALLDRGIDDIHVVDDFTSGLRVNLAGLDVVVYEGSILDPSLLDQAAAGAQSIVHLAARPSVPRSLKDPMATNEVNVTGTLRVLEVARRVGASVLVASSSSVYGRNSILPKQEEVVPMPVSPYAASKLATESYALAYASSFGMRALAFRFFNVFGPLQTAGHAYAAVVPAFLDAALRGEPLIVYGDGKQTRDFTFVDNVAGVLTDAVVRQVMCDRPVNLAFGGRATLLQLIEVVEEVIGAAVAVRHLPPRQGDVRDSQADGVRLRKLFPHAQPTSLSDGVRATYEWMQAEHRRIAVNGK